MKAGTRRTSRRNFLLAVAAGGVATGAAIAVRTAGPQGAGKEPGRRSSRGYHASEHINNYYRTTKV